MRSRLCETPGVGELSETGSRVEVTQAGAVGGGRGVVVFNGDRVSVWDDGAFR